ncbi:MAG: thioredoxin domain-containing protein [Planctomycetes bacterium]|nr:thioredoxin domain-containing protein [Planctomycetota bacterium]
MASRRKRAKKKSPRRPRSAAPGHGAAASAQPHPSSGLVLAAMVPLIIAIGASLMLVLQHLDALSLPGCGPGSACAELTQGAWGKVPLVNWPVSFVGLAYFLALLGAWIQAGRARGVSIALKYLVWVGAAFSVMFIMVMIFSRHLCWYCLAVHVANFGFLVTVQRSATASAASLKPLVWIGVVFLVASGAQEGARRSFKQLAEKKAEREQAESTQRIIESTTAGRTEGFTGRHLIGPAEAPIRLVIISDYQCPDCKRIEAQASAILDQRDDISLSAKHFPMCTDCNRNARKTLHPNACWAARAAETAGILRGNDGFWQMHRWLFDRGGAFTDAELHQGLRELGYDPQQLQQFLGIMQSRQPLELITADTDEASALGLHYTPMVFINGVELKGWNAPNALIRAVAALAATNPPRQTAAHDRPPAAAKKYVADWREQPARSIPADSRAWTIGPQDAKVDVVVWGDYQEPFTAEADGILRRIAASRPDTRYTFRHFPFNQECNPATQSNRHPLACRAAQAAEAAGALGGTDGYWKMHDWLMSNQRQFSDATLRGAAADMGLDPEALFAQMETPDVAAAITEDARAGKTLGLRSIPMIFINNKFVPRWRFQEHRTLQRMIEEAAQ